MQAQNLSLRLILSLHCTPKVLFLDGLKQALIVWVW
jgi:hypothetical protein